MRIAAQTTRMVYDVVWEIRDDERPIKLHWSADCEPSRTRLSAVDARAFTHQWVSGPIRVVSSAFLARFVDAERGISITNERVVDVDIIPAVF